VPDDSGAAAFPGSAPIEDVVTLRVSHDHASGLSAIGHDHAEPPDRAVGIAHSAAAPGSGRLSASGQANGQASGQASGQANGQARLDSISSTSAGFGRAPMTDFTTSPPRYTFMVGIEMMP